MFSFLDYLNDFNPDNLRIVREASNLKRRADLAKIVGVSEDIVKTWFMDQTKSRSRSPSRQTWNLLMFELEARHLGYLSLVELLQKGQEDGYTAKNTR